MITSFSHPGLLGLYVAGRVTALQTAEDRRCVTILDLLASLRADEPIPGWLHPACLVGEVNGYCVPISQTLSLAFYRNGAEIGCIRLISTAFEAARPNRENPACIERRPSHPGIIFRTLFLPAAGLSVAAAARHLGVPQGAIYKFFSGDRRAVGKFTLGLAELTETSVDFWLRLQSAHDVFVLGSNVTPHIPLTAILHSIEAGSSLRRGRRISGHIRISRAM
ncbi:MAG: helix-turn-helix transcriptional regulator [Bacteroidota bacterium]